MLPGLRVLSPEHPMDDYYRKLFKSLHKNKEEMLRLMEEQSLFQLSQVGLKVCTQTLPHASFHIRLCYGYLTYLLHANADQRIAEGAQPGACVIDVGPESELGSRRAKYAAEAEHAVTKWGWARLTVSDAIAVRMGRSEMKYQCCNDLARLQVVQVTMTPLCFMQRDARGACVVIR
jgi:hypothetical protein